MTARIKVSVQTVFESECPPSKAIGLRHERGTVVAELTCVPFGEGRQMVTCLYIAPHW